MADRPTATASKDSGPDPLIGRVINDKFKVLGFIARGGMGKVYRAEQAPLGRVCALKVLNPNYTGEHDPEFHKRFFLEASMTSKLRHPNTVTIFDYGHTEDGIYYMAMEYLEGYTLHRAIRQVGHLPEERTAHIARQICRSLREAHSLSVVHRDLKPANVYLLEHGDEPDFVKVLDFGLVKDVASGSEELTKAGLFMGSPKYMAPEQITGAPIDGRTDIYALGVIMYEMLTGKVPFDRAKSLEILSAHMDEEVPPLRKMNPAVKVSPALEEAVMRSLAKSPNDRFRSMDEVLAALKRLGPVTVPEPSSSLTADRPSTGSGPTASRIVRGAGAALAVPSGRRIATGAATGSHAMPAAEPSSTSAAALASQSRQRDNKTYLVLAVVVGMFAVVASIAYLKLQAEHAPPAVAGAGAGQTSPATAPVPGTPSGATAATAASAPGEPQKPVAEVDFFALSPVPATSAKPAAAAAPAPNAGALPGGKPRVAPPPPPHPSSATPPPPAAKPASDCNPSYYYDSDGNKHFKPECFGR
jgi:serine/threonine protein kinase